MTDVITHNVGGSEPGGTPTTIGKWTFSTKMVRDVVLDAVNGRVLNACAGKTKLEKRGCEFVRNDVNPDVDADTHHDVRNIDEHYPARSFDAVILDPPFDTDRAEALYEGWHAAGYVEARNAVASLVKPGGVVVELGWNSWGLCDRDGWKRNEWHVYRRGPIHPDVNLVVDRKTQAVIGD